MVQLLQKPLARRHTLLAVCPNSEAVTRAALEAAAVANAPLLYAATLNQVDVDGGYTGWTPAVFARFVREESERMALDIPVVLCLDHGGPWKKDRHVREDRTFEETMADVYRSLEACIDAGYELLHVDTTEDRRLPPGQPVPVDHIVAQTVHLMQHAEAYRAQQQRAPLAYEVGTEEVGSGLQSEQRFGDFVTSLGAALRDQHLPPPSFIVGDVGTALDTAHFNPVRARRLSARAQQIGALIKGHYTDGVTNPEAYPLSGMGGANVGPEFSAVEYMALADLVRLERQLGKRAGLRQALREALIDSGRWKKWRRPEESGLDFEHLAPDRQAWLIETGSRYVWTHPAVVSARQRLYDNVAAHRDADAYVRWRIREAILHYYHVFNLIDFNNVLLRELPKLLVQ